MSSEIVIKLIKMKQLELDNLEMLKKYYKGEDKTKKISEQLVILNWLNKKITRITNGYV